MSDFLLQSEIKTFCQNKYNIIEQLQKNLINPMKICKTPKQKHFKNSKLFKLNVLPGSVHYDHERVANLLYQSNLF